MVIVLQKLVVDIVRFVRLKLKKNKKQEIESFVEKILIYLNCNVVKELEAKKSKFYGERPTMMMT